jgi:hypothetical protein
MYMESAGDYRPFNVNMGFFIAICGIGVVYLPLICELTGNFLNSIGFWDKLKSLPDLFQLFILVAMFVGLGVIVERAMELVESAFKSLFGLGYEVEAVPSAPPTE